MSGEATSAGTLLGGKVTFEQPVRGYRAAIDPVLLAAAVPVRSGRALELGAGSGAASLCLAWRNPALALAAIEIDAATADLARRNVAANGFAARVEVIACDVAAVPSRLHGAFDAVFFNPPFDVATRTSASPDGDKRRAHVEGPEPLGAWIACARRCLKPRGRLALIHRADRLPEILARLQAGFGDIEILPLWPMRGRAAKRVILRARLGARGGATLLAGLLLHEPGGGYSAAAERVLRAGEALDAVLGDESRAADPSAA